MPDADLLQIFLSDVMKTTRLDFLLNGVERGRSRRIISVHHGNRPRDRSASTQELMAGLDIGVRFRRTRAPAGAQGTAGADRPAAARHRRGAKRHSRARRQRDGKDQPPAPRPDGSLLISAPSARCVWRDRAEAGAITLAVTATHPCVGVKPLRARWKKIPRAAASAKARPDVPVQHQTHVVEPVLPPHGLMAGGIGHSYRPVVVAAPTSHQPSVGVMGLSGRRVEPAGKVIAAAGSRRTGRPSWPAAFRRRLRACP